MSYQFAVKRFYIWIKWCEANTNSGVFIKFLSFLSTRSRKKVCIYIGFYFSSKRKMFLCFWFYYRSWEAIATKVSSGQGIVMGWSNPNSSSALLSRDWKQGWFKNETGTIYLFFWLSPTYTARNPFGVEAALLVRIFFAAKIPRIIAISLSQSLMKFLQMDQGKRLSVQVLSYWLWFGFVLRWKAGALSVYMNQWGEVLTVDCSVSYKRQSSHGGTLQLQ